jgi:hypothetical protein
MDRVGMLVIAASGLAVAGCSGASPTSGLFAVANQPPPQHWTLHVKSEPPGAEVRAPQGQSCRTPCELTLPMADTSVTFALKGYHGQTHPVKWLPATFHYEMYERTDEPGVEYPTDFSPNPVIARLDPAPAPPAKRKSNPKPKRQAAAPPPALPTPR